MGEDPDPVEIQKAGHALDGVEGSEDGVDVVLVVGLLFEVEDVQLDLADVLEALGDEVLQERLVLDLGFAAGAASAAEGSCDSRRSARGRRSSRSLQRNTDPGGQLAHEILDAPVVTACIAVSVGHGL